MSRLPRFDRDRNGVGGAGGGVGGGLGGGEGVLGGVTEGPGHEPHHDRADAPAGCWRSGGSIEYLGVGGGGGGGARVGEPLGRGRGGGGKRPWDGAEGGGGRGGGGGERGGEGGGGEGGGGRGGTGGCMGGGGGGAVGGGLWGVGGPGGPFRGGGERGSPGGRPWAATGHRGRREDGETTGEGGSTSGVHTHQRRHPPARPAGRSPRSPRSRRLVAGSGRLVETLLASDLVDELRLMVFPTILGRGRRLFPGGIDRLRFRAAQMKPVGPDGGQVQTYVRARGGGDEDVWRGSGRQGCAARCLSLLVVGRDIRGFGSARLGGRPMWGGVRARRETPQAVSGRPEVWCREGGAGGEGGWEDAPRGVRYGAKRKMEESGPRPREVRSEPARVSPGPGDIGEVGAQIGQSSGVNRVIGADERLE